MSHRKKRKTRTTKSINPRPTPIGIIFSLHSLAFMGFLRITHFYEPHRDVRHSLHGIITIYDTSSLEGGIVVYRHAGNVFVSTRLEDEDGSGKHTVHEDITMPQGESLRAMLFEIMPQRPRVVEYHRDSHSLHQ